MKQYSGYTALTTAIIISVTMILIGVSLSFSSLFARTNGLTASLKQKSVFAAQGCLEHALLKLSLDNTYQANETVTVQASGESLTCTLLPITVEGTNKVIKANAIVNDTTTNLILKVDGSTLERVSLEEVNTL